ncbi:MAG: hypothetical protein LBG48_05810 [Rickettsiales bacterium]|nr:hypothetical protein [Rickettsiales bacterium]
MKEHFLIENAFRFQVPVVVLAPDNYTYLPVKGYWVDNDTGEAMMLSQNPRILCTKKRDIETGEDQK